MSVLLVCASTGLGAEPQELKFQISQDYDTGTMRDSKEAFVVYKEAKLDLAKISLGSGPLGLKGYIAGEERWVVWGWSSSGGGEEAQHLFYIQFRDGKLELLDQLKITGPRGAMSMGFSGVKATLQIVLLGGGDDVMREQMHVESARFKERTIHSLNPGPAKKEKPGDKIEWKTPYFLDDHTPDFSGWQIGISVFEGRIVLERAK